tara:strand:- start:462 stop:734 length:273 start_codon:yes stop_codon:yes gene_type:complete
MLITEAFLLLFFAVLILLLITNIYLNNYKKVGNTILLNLANELEKEKSIKKELINIDLELKKNSAFLHNGILKIKTELIQFAYTFDEIFY